MIFQHAEGNRQLYHTVVGTESGRTIQSSFHQHVSAHIRGSLKAKYSQFHHPLITQEILEHYVVSTVMSLLRLWLDQQSHYTATEMTEMCEVLVNPGLDNVVDRL